MEKILGKSIFADHYQLYIYDSNERYWETVGVWSDEDFLRGYLSNGKAVHFGTYADLNVHWLEVYLSTIPPSLGECERALAFNFSITSGILSITNLIDEEETKINVENGDYILYILAFNLGVNIPSPPEDSGEFSDEEIEQMTEIERYKIVLVPGRTDHKGVIKGDQYLNSIG